MNDMAKNLILWVIIAIVLMSVFNNFTAQRSAGTNVPYSDFLEDVRTGNVSEVRIDGNTIEGVTSSGTHFTTYSPGDDGLVSDLIKPFISTVIVVLLIGNITQIILGLGPID